MKNIVLIMLFVAGAFQLGTAQSKIDTVEFKVSGVCGMCKSRIENAGLIKGVKFIEWNKDTQMVKVIYKEEKVTPEEIEKAIAEAGHDTENQKATAENYGALPGCCQYKDGVEVH